MKRSHYGKTHLFIVSLFWAIIALYIVYIIYSSKNDDLSDPYNQIQQEIITLRKQNMLLQVQILDHQSFLHIASAAAQMGLTEKGGRYILK